MTQPPGYAIEIARQTALKSPCAKSRRGVVLFTCDPRYGRDGLTTIAGVGFNGQPSGFGCDRSDACRRGCAKLCLHAEQRAIMDAIGGPSPWSSLPLDDLELVHVKVVDEQVVPGGGPSCWQCSRLVVEVGLRGVWLFEAQRWHDELTCQACRRVTIVAQHAGTTGVCERCDQVYRLLEMPGKRVYDPQSGAWRFYEAARFHRETLRACGIGAAP